MAEQIPALSRGGTAGRFNTRYGGSETRIDPSHWAARHAMGLAVIRAQSLEARPEMLVAFHADKPGDRMTEVMITWQDNVTGRVIEAKCSWHAGPGHVDALEKPASGSSLRAMLMCEIVGPAPLLETLSPEDKRDLMSEVCNGVKCSKGPNAIVFPSDESALMYLWFDDAGTCGAFALALEDLIVGLDWESRGLTAAPEIRITGDFKPASVAETEEQQGGGDNSFLVKVCDTRPMAPPGEVYITEALAAELALAGKAFVFAYAGRVPSFDERSWRPMYVLKQRE